MRPSPFATFVLPVIFIAALTPAIPGQWAQGVAPIAGIDGFVYCTAFHDDGTGPALYAGGQFTAAGSAAVNGIARWNGSTWSAVGLGFAGTVYALASFDDGSGPKLYAGGAITSGGIVYQGTPTWYVARWDGISWSKLTANDPDSTVRALAIYDDGSGPKLYAGGGFNNAGGASAKSIARWNGTAWSAVGGGLNSGVRALRVFNDGTGNALYAAGSFTSFFGPGGGAVTSPGIARWTAAGWAPVGAGLASNGSPPLPVHSLEVYDAGSGPRLYAGGEFDHSGAVTLGRVAKWSGAAWQGLTTGLTSASPANGPIAFALRSVDPDGPGGTPPILLVGGAFDHAGGIAVNDLAAWNGSSWLPFPAQGSDHHVLSITAVPSPSGDGFIVGGYFTAFDGIAVRSIVQWQGGAWAPVGNGLGVDPYFANGVNAAVVLDDGTGPAIYGGGVMAWGGQAPANRIVKWNGSTLAPIGPVFAGEILYLGVLDDGTGPALYVAGNFAAIDGVPSGGVARWNGSSFASLGSPPGTIYELAVFDDGNGPALYAAGNGFNSLTRWTGAAWVGVAGAPTGVIRTVEIFDPDGSGPGAPRLYCGGEFSSAGGIGASNIAAWSGAAWTALGAGISGSSPTRVNDLLVFDDGSGAALYAGGWFYNAGTVTANGIARWNGAVWSNLGNGVNQPRVESLGLYDDGSGSGTELYAGGLFDSGPVWITQQPTRSIARFDGSEWRPLGVGMGDGYARPQVMISYDDGTGPVLVIGGTSVAVAGGYPNFGLTAWRGAAPVLFLSQPGPNGSPFTIDLDNLIPGHEYTTLFNTEHCLGQPGFGPFLGLCGVTSLPFLIFQFNLPVGNPPIHFIATAGSHSFGPYSLPAQSLHMVCFDRTGGVLGPGSTVSGFTIY